jgi:uncharacterized lipoprotein
MKKLLLITLMIVFLAGCDRHKEYNKFEQSFQVTLSSIRVGKPVPPSAIFLGQTPTFTKYRIRLRTHPNVFGDAFYYVAAVNDTIVSVNTSKKYLVNGITTDDD